MGLVIPTQSLLFFFATNWDAVHVTVKLETNIKDVDVKLQTSVSMCYSEPYPSIPYKYHTHSSSGLKNSICKSTLKGPKNCVCMHGGRVGVRSSSNPASLEMDKLELMLLRGLKLITTYP